MSIGFIEGLVETAEEGGHGEIDAAVTEVNCRIDEDWFAHGVAEKIVVPQISMEQGG